MVDPFQSSVNRSLESSEWPIRRNTLQEWGKSANGKSKKLRKGTFYFCVLFLGRPLGRNVDSSPRRRAVRVPHRDEPNGVPRLRKKKEGEKEGIEKGRGPIERILSRHEVAKEGKRLRGLWSSPSSFWVSPNSVKDKP